MRNFISSQKNWGKLVFALLLTFMAISLSANEINLITFQEAKADFQAERNSVMDMNMSYCSALKIESDFTDQIKLKQKVYQKENADANSAYFYISSTETFVDIVAPNNKPYRLNAPKSGFKKGSVYYVRLESVPETHAPVSEKPIPAVTTPEPVVKGMWGQTEERLGVNFTIKYAEIFDNKLIVTFELNNTKDDLDMMIHGWYGAKFTRVIDEKGNEFKPSKIIFANNSGQRDIKTNLVQDIPTQLKVVFEEIKTKPTKIAKMDLGVWTKDSESFRISYRDIPIDVK